MATYKAHLANYLYYHNGPIDDVQVLLASPTLFRLGFGARNTNTTDFIGSSLTYNQGNYPTGGTLTQITSYAGGMKAYDIDGFSVSAVAVASSYHTVSQTDYEYTDAGVLVGITRIDARDYGFSSILAGNDVMYGSPGADPQLDGQAGNDSIQGFGGNDGLYGGVGDDSLFGGTGDDHLIGGPGANWLQGDDGNDTIKHDSHASDFLGRDVMLGGNGNDVLDASTNTNPSLTSVLIGGSGADSVIGGAGNDWVEGGFFDNQNDTVSGSGGNDTVVGGGGFDVLHGDAGNDLLAQASGRGMLYGDDGDDWIYGAMGYNGLTGAGDTIEGGKGADNMVGFGGNDTFVFNKGHMQPGVLDTIHGFGDHSGGLYGPDQDVIRFEGISAADMSYVDSGTGVTINVDLFGDGTAQIFVWGMQSASIGDDLFFAS